MSRVLVIGCGYVGSALAARLVARGDEVWGLARRPQGLPAGVRPIGADLADRASLAALPARLDAAVHAAGPGAFDEDAYRVVYETGLRRVLDQLAATSPDLDRFVLIGSTSVYGQTEGEWVDESTPPGPPGPTGRILLAAESIVEGAAPWTVRLRLGGIYGPGRTGLIDEARAGRIAAPSDPPAYSNRIHREDAAGAIEHVLTLGDPDPLYLVVDHDPAPRAEVLAWIASRLGVAASSPPDSPARRSRRPPTSKRCRNDRLVASGYTLRYPSYREGYGELLRGV